MSYGGGVVQALKHSSTSTNAGEQASLLDNTRASRMATTQCHHTARTPPGHHTVEKDDGAGGAPLDPAMDGAPPNLVEVDGIGSDGLNGRGIHGHAPWTPRRPIHDRLNRDAGR
jgi:hypothetical protein